MPSTTPLSVQFAALCAARRAAKTAPTAEQAAATRQQREERANAVFRAPSFRRSRV